MPPLVIFGAGGLGRELWGWIEASSQAFRAQWPVEAFVADDAEPGAVYGGLPVRRRSDFAATPPLYLLAVGEPGHRRTLSTELTAAGWRAATWIHESSLIGKNVVIGEGSLIFPNVTLASDCRIGRFVLINGRCGVGHDCEVGDYSALFGHAAVNGNVRIGREVVIGSGAIIHPKTNIGDRATVGIGSVVIRSVKPGASIFGNPAKQLVR